jgi:hypothetical protein
MIHMAGDWGNPDRNWSSVDLGRPIKRDGDTIDLLFPPTNPIRRFLNALQRALTP